MALQQTHLINQSVSRLYRNEKCYECLTNSKYKTKKTPWFLLRVRLTAFENCQKWQKNLKLIFLSYIESKYGKKNIYIYICITFTALSLLGIKGFICVQVRFESSTNFLHFECLMPMYKSLIFVHICTYMIVQISIVQS